jgi:hypothetical protein
MCHAWVPGSCRKCDRVDGEPSGLAHTASTATETGVAQTASTATGARPGPDTAQSNVSSATNAAKAIDSTPLTVKNAASSRRRSPGQTIMCS